VSETSGGSDETVKPSIQKFVCRVITYDKLTAYLTEDFSREMNFLKGIDLDSILSPSAIFLDKTTIYVMYEQHPSLTKFLNPT